MRDNNARAKRPSEEKEPDNETHKLLPKSKGIKFLFYVLSFEMIKKIPYLQQYQEHAETVDPRPA